MLSSRFDRVSNASRTQSLVIRLMTDEQYEKILKILEEIRDLTKSRNEKLDALRDGMQNRAEDAKRRQIDFQTDRKCFQRRLVIALSVVVVFGGVFVWWVSRPSPGDLEYYKLLHSMVESNQSLEQAGHPR